MTEDARIEWLNGYITKDDLEVIGITKHKKDWTSLRRWQADNLCRYALNQPMLYGQDGVYEYQDQLVV